MLTKLPYKSVVEPKLGDNLNCSQMRDNLNSSQMEDNLNFSQIEDDLNFVGIWKTTSIFSKRKIFLLMEDDLIFFWKMEDDINIW